MKRTLIILAMIAGVLAFTGKGYAQEEKDNWPELTAFHKVMAQTFHPSEEGNLAPIKERSGEMLKKAEVLLKSKIPAENNNKKVITALKNLKKGCKKVDKLVKSKASDQDITKSLSELHDLFHTVAGACTHEE
jgi:hypothetical protein